MDDFSIEAARIDLEWQPGTTFQDEISTFAAHAREHDRRNGFLQQKHGRITSPGFAAEMDASERREFAVMRECVYQNRYDYREKRAAFVR